jgi:hypothetical protein
MMMMTMMMMMMMVYFGGVHIQQFLQNFATLIVIKHER